MTPRLSSVVHYAPQRPCWFWRSQPGDQSDVLCDSALTANVRGKWSVRGDQSCCVARQDAAGLRITRAGVVAQGRGHSFSERQGGVSMKTVLVLGGSGYLGQFLVQDLAKDYKVRRQAVLRGHSYYDSTP